MLKRITLSIFTLIFLFSYQKLYSAPGDTTWITAFDQEYHNWADMHYKSITLPDTNHHWEKIIMTYKIGCPAAGCDPWDRVGWLRLFQDTTNNIYYEIARIVTPYNIVGGGYPGTCTFTFDVTDFMPLLHDNVLFGNYIESWIGGNKGWLATIKFAFIEGEVYYKPFKVVNLYQLDYLLFGDTANPHENYLTPKNVLIDPKASMVKVRVITTGHGQGNSGNAAEFINLLHSVVAGSDTTSHFLWRTCSNNPCSPQGGTWQYARAGWCPGAGVNPWIVDVSNSVSPGMNASLQCMIEAYINECRPTNPNCTTGVTCPDCNYNSTGHTEPNWKMQAQVIMYRINPIGVNNGSIEIPKGFKLEQNYPNPFNPSTSISFAIEKNGHVLLNVYNAEGKFIKELMNKQMISGNYEIKFDGENLPSGVYFYKIEFDGKTDTKKMLLIK